MLPSYLLPCVIEGCAEWWRWYLDLFGVGHFLKTAPKWPRMAQNHRNGSKWHCMNPNDPKTLPMGILHDFMSCWTTLGPFGYPRGPQNGPKQHRNGPEWLKITRMAQNGTAWPQMILKHFPWVYYMIICHVGPPWGHSGTHRGPKTALKCPRMAQNSQNGFLVLKL